MIEVTVTDNDSEGGGANPFSTMMTFNLIITERNKAPSCGTAPVDRTFTVGDNLNGIGYAAGSATDPNSGDTLAYSYNMHDGSALPTWFQLVNAATG